jgi:hypothetical protein
MPGVAAHAWNPSTQGEVESRDLRLVCITQWDCLKKTLSCNYFCHDYQKELVIIFKGHCRNKVARRRWLTPINPSYFGRLIGFWLEATCTKSSCDPHLQNNQNNVVEHLLCKREVLSSNPNPPKGVSLPQNKSNQTPPQNSNSGNLQIGLIASRSWKKVRMWGNLSKWVFQVHQRYLNYQ